MDIQFRNLALTSALAAGALLAALPAARAQTGRMPQSTSPYPSPNANQGPGTLPDATAINTVSDSDFAKQAAQGQNRDLGNFLHLVLLCYASAQGCR